MTEGFSTTVDSSTDSQFDVSIAAYQKLNITHINAAKRLSMYIFLLILAGLMVVVGMPYLLATADKYFKSSVSLDAVERKINTIEESITDTINETPSLIAHQVYTMTDESQPIYYPGLKQLAPAVVSDSDIGVIAGFEGLILISDTTGESWNQHSTLVSDSLNPPVFFGENYGVITGSEGSILHSQNSGKTWSIQSNETSQNLQQAVFFENGQGVITGNHGALLLKAGDSEEWIISRLTTDSALNKPAIDGRLGIITGENGEIIRTNDSGSHWNKIESGSLAKLNRANFITENIILITTDAGTVLRSTDAGLTWETINTSVDSALNSRVVTHKKSQIITGEKGTLLVSLDLGASWTYTNFQLIGDLNTPVFTDKGVGITTGDDGAFLKSIDNGVNWKKTPYSINTDLNLPIFFGALGIISGDEGALFISNDFGMNWIEKVTGVPSDLKEPKQLNNGVLLIAGDDGTLLMSVDKGETWTDQNTGIPTDLQPPILLDSGAVIISGYESIYTIENIENLLNEDKTADLVIQLQSSTRHVQAGILSQLAEQKILLEEFKSALVEFDKNDVNDRLEKSLIRASALAVIMFLVQILISNYRYSVKLAAFYLSRSQALEIIRELGTKNLNAEDLNTVTAMLTPNIDYGKQPPDSALNSSLSVIDKLRKV